MNVNGIHSVWFYTPNITRLRSFYIELFAAEPLVGDHQPHRVGLGRRCRIEQSRDRIRRRRRRVCNDFEKGKSDGRSASRPRRSHVGEQGDVRGRPRRTPNRDRVQRSRRFSGRTDI